MSKDSTIKERTTQGWKVSKQTNNLYSAEINKRVWAHYCPAARTGVVSKN